MAEKRAVVCHWPGVPAKDKPREGSFRIWNVEYADGFMMCIEFGDETYWVQDREPLELTCSEFGSETLTLSFPEGTSGDDSKVVAHLEYHREVKTDDDHRVVAFTTDIEPGNAYPGMLMLTGTMQISSTKTDRERRAEVRKGRMQSAIAIGVALLFVTAVVVLAWLLVTTGK